MTPAPVFDKVLLRARRRRALQLGAETFLLARVAGEMAERLAAVTRHFAVAADIHSPGDTLRVALAHAAVGRLIAVGASPAQLGGSGWRVAADEEALPFAPGSLNLAVSALALQSVDDLPGVLAQVRRALRPDGLFMAALLGGETLTELRQSFALAEAECDGGVSPRVAPFIDVRDMGALLQRAGFALPVADVDRVTVRYATPLALCDDLRRMGATNPLAERRRTPLRRATFLRMIEIYTQRFADADGRVRATFDIVWASGWAPHESQPKPLAPGSATHSLADALAPKRNGSPKG